MRRRSAKGIIVTGVNVDISMQLEGREYYVDTCHSRNYIHQVWSEYFAVVEIVPIMAAYQDVVVMRRR
jgi:hypothetical protein